MGGPIIHFEQATLAYGRRVALEDITLDVAEGEFLGIIGPNGSGKTTMLRAILGLLPPVRGSARVFDCACEALRCAHRARIGYLPQMGASDPYFPITAYEAVLMGRYSAIGLLRRPGPKDREMARAALRDVGMEPSAATPLAHLSGGQQQRVMIARALAAQPEILLLDEPTTGIDLPSQQDLMELIVRLHKIRGLTVLLVTHDVNLIRSSVHRLALLNRRLHALGPPETVLTKEILTRVYGREVIMSGPYILLGDYHHA